MKTLPSIGHSSGSPLIHRARFSNDAKSFFTKTEGEKSPNVAAAASRFVKINLCQRRLRPAGGAPLFCVAFSFPPIYPLRPEPHRAGVREFNRGCCRVLGALIARRAHETPPRRVRTLLRSDRSSIFRAPLRSAGGQLRPRPAHVLLSWNSARSKVRRSMPHAAPPPTYWLVTVRRRTSATRCGGGGGCCCDTSAFRGNWKKENVLVRAKKTITAFPIGAIDCAAFLDHRTTE